MPLFGSLYVLLPVFLIVGVLMSEVPRTMAQVLLVVVVGISDFSALPPLLVVLTPLLPPAQIVLSMIVPGCSSAARTAALTAVGAVKEGRRSVGAKEVHNYWSLSVVKSWSTGGVRAHYLP